MGEVIPADTEVATDSFLQMPIFDKSTMFAFAIANAATVLENAQKEMTPFYLVSPTESALWLNEAATEKDTRATAGIVDIVNGKRSSVTKIGDVARYILAVSSFLDATDEIEKTKSSLLKAKDDSGKRKLDILIEAREKLKMLLTCLANMLSGTLQSEDGSFAAEFNKDSHKVSGKASAVDSALAIEALVKVADLYNAEVYSTAAIEGYYAMNRNLWNKDLQFYSEKTNNKVVPSYNELVSILNSINTLAPHMPKESRLQWNAITKNLGIGALELLSNNLKEANK